MGNVVEYLSITVDSTDKLLSRIEGSRGKALYEEETRIALTLDTVEYNKYDLNSQQKKIQNEATEASQQPISQARQCEFLQDFYNYLSSLYMLYKHGNRYKKKFFCCHRNGTESCEECDRENVDSLDRCGVLPDWNFVRKMRVYVNHYRSPLLQSPVTYSSHSIGSGNLIELNEDGVVVLNKSTFLDWADRTDNDEANDFVENAVSIEPINIAIKLYSSKERYYEWLLTQVRERNAEAIEEYRELVESL